MDSMRILRLWAASAWADNILHPAEAAALERYIEASDDLSSEQREEAHALLRRAPVVDLAEEVRALSPVSRQGVYRAAHAIVRLDRVVTPDEEQFLARLRAALELDEAVIESIESGH
jgi:uncharacterized membrane protein YebE (DUF533 family)